MRLQSLVPATATFAAVTHGLNILITNDDGFATANTRELYKTLNGLGHSCYIVAPPTDQSNINGGDLFTSSPVLLSNSQWDIIKAGAQSVGRDPHDERIWYYNGSSIAQVIVALDFILPNFGAFHTPDLVLSGPDYGWNVGPFLYTASGTVGAAITAIERGIPAIAFSSGNTVAVPFTRVNSTTQVGLQDPATITAHLAATLIQTLVEKAQGAAIMPTGYGMTVNFPYITSLTNNSCTNPPFVLSRMSPFLPGRAVFSNETGIFTLLEEAPTHSKLSGTGPSKDSHKAELVLPTEREVLNSHCFTSVSVFTVGLDASGQGHCLGIPDFADMVPFATNGTLPSMDPDLPNGNTTVVVVSNGTEPQAQTQTSPVTGPPTVQGVAAQTRFSLGAFVLVLCVAGLAL